MCQSRKSVRNGAGAEHRSGARRRGMRTLPGVAVRFVARHKGHLLRSHTAVGQRTAGSVARAAAVSARHQRYYARMDRKQSQDVSWPSDSQSAGNASLGGASGTQHEKRTSWMLVPIRITGDSMCAAQGCSHHIVDAHTDSGDGGHSRSCSRAAPRARCERTEGTREGRAGQAVAVAAAATTAAADCLEPKHSVVIQCICTPVKILFRLRLQKFVPCIQTH
jgi:hypothetical protein